MRAPGTSDADQGVGVVELAPGADAQAERADGARLRGQHLEPWRDQQRVARGRDTRQVRRSSGMAS